MDNPLPNPLLPLFALAAKMKTGLHDHEAAIGIKQNVEAAFTPDFDAAKLADEVYETAKKTLRDANTDQQNADDAAYDFIKLARTVLLPLLGGKWSQTWIDTGFPNQSTAVPGTMDERYELCDKLNKYFTQHPTYEVNTPNLVVTAAKALALYKQLTAAEESVKEADTAASQKKISRDDAVDVLRARMRGLISELGQKLDPLDPLWKAFGLNQPGADTTPDVPTGLTLTAGSAGMVLSTWNLATGAARYHVWLQIVGVDASYRNVDTVTSLTDTLTGLPSGKTANLQITAVNPAGESQPSNPASIVVP